MTDENERYFPNHKLERDIGLAEYGLTASRLNNDDKALVWATNAAIFVSSAVGFFSFKVSDFLDGLASAGVNARIISTLIVVALLFFSIVSVLHLSNMIRSRVFSERKIVVLRRMLGVEYGDTSLILPNWRIEGADNPFVIKLFPGLFSYQSASVHVVLTAVSVGAFLLWDTSFLASANSVAPSIEQPLVPLSVIFFWYIFVLGVFRLQLREENENYWLIISRMLAWSFRLPLAKNFEYNLYHVRLSIAEAHRIDADFATMENMATAIEDKDFLRHKGLNYRGILRAAWARIKGKTSGGGSSITQQFVRTNFIYDLSPKLSRKIVEIALAKWAERALSKEEILRGYLATVRFSRGVYGFHNAYRLFFLDEAKSVSKFEAFILIERLANVREFFLGRRILQLMRRLQTENTMDLSDCDKALDYYGEFLGHHFHLKSGDLSPKSVKDALHKKVAQD